VTEERIVLGRNFIESLVLTLIKHEINNPMLEVREAVTLELEEELCGLSYAFPPIINIYRESVTKVIKDMFPDIVLPDLKGCFLYEQVKRWIHMHRAEILERKGELMHLKDVERQERNLAIRIIRAAIMATLYKIGVVPIRT